MGGTAMIEGKLVNLRAVEIGDLDANVAWFNDREVTRHLASMRYPMSRASEEVWLRNRSESPLGFHNVFFAIETRDGRHIGNTGLESVSAENRNARLGIAIGDKDFWSKGYGADAIITLLRFGFDEMNLHRIDLTVDEDNARGIACYTKVGFVEEARLRHDRYTRGRYADTLVMGILRHEFEKRHGGGP
jgi:RimJ/RimL family protein N-acetyltransferase